MSLIEKPFGTFALGDLRDMLRRLSGNVRHRLQGAERHIDSALCRFGYVPVRKLDQDALYDLDKS